MPACVAWTEQVPAATKVAVAPLTVHTLDVVDAKETVKPELAEATSARGVPTVCAPGLAKAMLCAIRAAWTVKLCVTGAATA